MNDAFGFANWALPWWSVMVGVNVINLAIAVMIFFRSIKWKLREPKNSRYLMFLRTAGLIFVSVALYRSIFVSSYPDRLVWFDTIFNSPFLIRCFACLAELSFIGMIAAILIKLNNELPSGKKGKSRIEPILAKSPYVAVGCILLAQFFAFGGLITQYLTLFAIEEALWALAFLSIAPLVVIRLIQSKNQNNVSRSYKVFLIIMAVWCAGYLAFQGYALPFNYFSNLSQDIGRIIPNDALRQAVWGYTATRDFDAWGGLGFFIWHSGYFSICTWMVLFFMAAPRKLR